MNRSHGVTLSAVVLLSVPMLAGCAVPMNLTVTDRMTGDMGTATLDGRYHSGPITIVLRGEQYQGTFSSVRAPVGITPYGRWFDDGAGAANGQETADSGLALAFLRSPSGKSLDCGLRYAIDGLIVDPNVTGIGQCRDETGRDYDVQATNE